MGQEFKVSQEYFTEFDPEKFADQIKAQVAEESTTTDGAEEE